MVSCRCLVWRKVKRTCSEFVLSMQTVSENLPSCPSRSVPKLFQVAMLTANLHRTFYMNKTPANMSGDVLGHMTTSMMFV